MSRSAPNDAIATNAVTVHGKARLRKGRLARLSFADITYEPSNCNFTKRIHACCEGAQTGLSRRAVNTYTFLDERGCGKSWVSGAGRHFQSIQLEIKTATGQPQLAR